MIDSDLKYLPGSHGNDEIEGPESRTGRALENAYKYCPSGNVTRQISKWENWKVKNTGD